jgi:hypothetical protein
LFHVRDPKLTRFSLKLNANHAVCGESCQPGGADGVAETEC